ncbi:hypothetical protein APY04_0619 [Hyphomicrobium sulfonivorans]|uniref:Uncharacterized protein n=1 Tax=Hyphomicrobium sulfonivorans TaxID=121290 RepID=A0A109BLG2_HYPSL|nr:hypothetical protein APY04_0619 [Hyphomicrobium sulfonivorans]
MTAASNNYSEYRASEIFAELKRVRAFTSKQIKVHRHAA